MLKNLAAKTFPKKVLFFWKDMYLSKKKDPSKNYLPPLPQDKNAQVRYFFLVGGSNKIMGVNFFFWGGRILGIFRPFSVSNERPEISALFPGKRADFSFSAWAEGGFYQRPKWGIPGKGNKNVAQQC